MSSKRPAIIGICIITLLLLFLVICACFFPSFTVYLDTILTEANIVLSPLPAFVYTIGVLLTLPCVWILLKALRLSTLVASDRVFTTETARLLSHIAIVLFCDCIAFSAAVITLFLVGERLVSPLLGLIALVGLTLALMLRILSDYVRRAAEMQEEVEGTL